MGAKVNGEDIIHAACGHDCAPRHGIDGKPKADKVKKVRRERSA